MTEFLLYFKDSITNGWVQGGVFQGWLSGYIFPFLQLFKTLSSLCLIKSTLAASACQLFLRVVPTFPWSLYEVVGRGVLYLTQRDHLCLSWILVRVSPSTFITGLSFTCSTQHYARFSARRQDLCPQRFTIQYMITSAHRKGKYTTRKKVNKNFFKVLQ